MTDASKKDVSYDQKLGFDIKTIYRAAWFWYGKSDIDSCCLAENRLMRGEKPETNKWTP